MITHDEQLIWESYNSKSARPYFTEDALNSVGGFKSRSLLVEIPINEFLLLAETLPENQVRRDAFDYFSKIGKFDDVPILLSNGDTPFAKIVGHEGRHRARILRQKGMETMPVEFREAFIRWDELDEEDVIPEYLYNEEGTHLYYYPLDKQGNWLGLEEANQI